MLPVGVVEKVLPVGVVDKAVTVGVVDKAVPMGGLDKAVPVGVVDNAVPVGVVDKAAPVGVVDNAVPVAAVSAGAPNLAILLLRISSAVRAGSMGVGEVDDVTVGVTDDDVDSDAVGVIIVVGITTPVVFVVVVVDSGDTTGVSICMGSLGSSTELAVPAPVPVCPSSVIGSVVCPCPPAPVCACSPAFPAPRSFSLSSLFRARRTKLAI